MPQPEPLPLWLWPLLGALLLAPLRAAQFERVPVAAVNALIATAVVIKALINRRHATAGSAPLRPWRREPVTLCLGLFLALNLLSLATSIYVHGTLTALLDLSALFCAYLLLAHGGGGRRVVDWVLGAVLVAGLVASAQALQEYGIAATQHTAVAPHGDPGWRAFGPSFPNLLAATVILLAPVALALMLRVERTAEVFGAGVSVLLLVAALLVSGSRGGALALLAGGAAFAVVATIRGLRLGRKRARALLGLGVALLPVLWLLRVPMVGRLAHIPGTPALSPGSPAANASERSNTFRRLLWRATARIVRAKPLLGTGAGTFEFALPRYAEAGYTRMAHESYLQIAAEAGIPTLLAWLAALGLVLARLVSRRGSDDWLLPGLAGGLVAAMAHNLVDYSWSVTGTALPFWALLGSAVALTPTVEKVKVQHGAGEPRLGRAADSGGGRAPGETQRGDGETGKRKDRASSGNLNTRTPEHLNTRHSSRPTPNAQRLALGTAGVLLLALNGVWLMAAEHQDRAKLAVGERDARAAIDEYQAAAALAPLDGELQVRLAGMEEGLDEKQEAEQALQRAGALAPTWGRPHYRLGQLCERSGRLPEAAAEFEQAARRDPRSTQPLVELAKVREAQGDHPAALAVYQRIIALERSLSALDQMTDPNPAVAHEALGREAETHGDREAAIREYQAGAERLRQYRRERPYRTSIQEARGDNPSEREAEMLRLEVRLWQRLADLYKQTGRAQEAAEARREAAATEATAGQIDKPPGG